MTTNTPYPRSAADPTDINKAIGAGAPAIDSNAAGGSGHATGVGAMVRKTRAVLTAMNDAATSAEFDQASGGSGHSKPSK
jgi:hypothetical protein